MKKIILVVSVLALLITSLCFGSFGITASAATTAEGLYYTINDGEVTITGVNGWVDCTNIVIPAKIEGYAVTTIGKNAFDNNDGIKTVTMADSVTTIGMYAFKDCDNLETVKLSKNLKNIEDNSFWLCGELSGVTIPNTVEYIGSFAFAGTALDSVTIPAKASLGYHAFYLSDISCVILKNGISNISNDAFGGCDELTTVYLPKSVTDIKQNAFDDCTSLTDIWYEGSSKDKVKIELEGGNTALVNAKWHYNACKTNEHSYTSSCDTICNNCNWVRTTKTAHKYTNACDAKCNRCNYTRSVGEHKYTDIVDATCNECGAKRKITCDYTINTDKTLSLSHSATRDFYFTISDSSVASIENTSMSMSIINGYYSYSKGITITPKKLGAVIVRAVDNYGNVLAQSTVLIKEGSHKMVTTKVITKATTTKDGKQLKTCKYCGYKKEYTISKASKFSLSATSYTYNGKVQKPTVTVTDSKGNKITSSNYTVTYSSGCKNAGTYKVTIKMKDKYSATKTLTYKIKPLSASKCKASLSTTAYTYNGQVKMPNVTVKDSSGKKLKKNTDYTVTYASGRKNVGTYKVTVKMKGNYSGTKTLTFKILPAKTTVSKLTPGTKKITVAITKKSTQVTGYQVQYSTSKTFSKATTKTISSYKTTKTTLTGLSAKKTYFVRVRTYKTVNGTKYYSGWSTYKYTKTK